MESSQETSASQGTDGSDYVDESKTHSIARKPCTRSMSTCKDTPAVRRNNEDEDENNDRKDGPSRGLPRMPANTSANKRKERSSSGSSENDHQERSSKSLPNRQYGLRGKIGAIGALFKVELAQYGYLRIRRQRDAVGSSPLFTTRGLSLFAAR
ncbi:hypothetical protein F4782DRAFT_512268 [Xylaria castorea]|nr:hypothetical protein F4782DRAFT_512268 [Xylaria castorea]